MVTKGWCRRMGKMSHFHSLFSESFRLISDSVHEKFLDEMALMELAMIE